MYSIITMGGSDAVVGVLNAVAAAVGEDSFYSLLRLGVLFGFIWVLCQFLVKGSPMVLLSWFISVYLLYNLLLVPKMSIEVIDNVTHQKTVVDKVPLGVGLIASVTSTVGASLTRLFEPLFTIPEDLSYSRTGFVMGARLVDESRRLHISDSAFLKDLHHYMQQCVWYDLARGKYRLDELLKADATNGDTWAFIAQHASPVQAFLQQGEIVTCKKGVRTLTGQWQQATLYGQSQLGQRLFSHTSPREARALVVSQLPLSVAYLTGVSQTANQLVQQNLLLNALDTSLASHAAGIGATAAITHYATLRANQQVRSQYSAGYAMATHWLPIAKTVIEALLIGGFLLVAVIMLLPGGGKTLVFYAKSLLWIELWSPLYAILHGMMLTLARHGSQSILSLYDTTSINAFTWSGIVTVNHDIALYAGYATLLIPLIAWGLVSGAGFALTAIASNMIGVTQGGAQRASEEISTGNVGFGNVNYGNVMAENTSKHHWNTHADFQDVGFTEQLAQGSQLTTMPDGGVVMDNHPALSQLAVSGDFSKRLQAMSQHQFETSLSVLDSQLGQYGMALTKAIQEATHLSKTILASEGSTTLTQFSEIRRFAETAQKISHENERFAEQEHVAVTKATQVLGEVSLAAHLRATLGANMQGSFSEKETLAGALSPPTKAPLSAKMFGVGVSLGLLGDLSLGGRLLLRAQRTKEDQTLHQHAEEFIKETGYQKTFEEALQQAKEWNVHHSHGTDQQFANNVAASLEEASHLRQEIQHTLQTAQGYHDLAEVAFDESVTINQNANQAFMTWLLTHEHLSVTDIEAMMLHEPARANQYWQHFASDEMARLTKTVTDKLPTKAALKAHYDLQQGKAKAYGKQLKQNITVQEKRFAKKAGERFFSPSIKNEVFFGSPTSDE